MNREDIIRMAREAGWDDHHAQFDTRFQTFAALVIANHPPQSFMTWQEGYEAGKQNERNRILAICKEGLWDAEGIRYHLDKQARGQA